MDGSRCQPWSPTSLRPTSSLPQRVTTTSHVLVGFEVARFLSATGVGLLIAVASGTFLCSHKGLAGFALESNMIATCSNTTVYVGVIIFALCGPVGVSVGFEAARFLSARQVSPTSMTSTSARICAPVSCSQAARRKHFHCWRQMREIVRDVIQDMCFHCFTLRHRAQLTWKVQTRRRPTFSQTEHHHRLRQTFFTEHQEV